MENQGFPTTANARDADDVEICVGCLYAFRNDRARL
jgi:hypothetical protein